jgi:hypothetical protein
MKMVGVMYCVGGSAMLVQVTCKSFAVEGMPWCADVVGFNDVLLCLHHNETHNSCKLRS